MFTQGVEKMHASDYQLNKTGRLTNGFTRLEKIKKFYEVKEHVVALTRR